MRAVGYTLETAVANIINNSISANANEVDIYFTSETADHLAIVDDGDGKTADEIQNAMRLAGRSPNAHRGTSDVGRFGLGLKTATASDFRSIGTIPSKAVCTKVGLPTERQSVALLAIMERATESGFDRQ